MVLVLLMAVGQEGGCLDGKKNWNHFDKSQYTGIISGSGSVDPVMDGSMIQW